MTPAKRRPATPASQGPTRTAPDVPVVADQRPGPDANTTDRTQLLGPEGEPLVDSAAAAESGGDDADERSTTPSRGRSGTFYPLPVWPD